MAIDRAPFNLLQDDDGSNLVGTIWNKDKIKTVILDPVDAAILPASGAWTPIDASGAGLVFNDLGSRYWQFDKLVIVTTVFVYPATANGASAVIGGLPFPNGPTYGGFYSANAAINLTYLLDPAATAFVPRKINAAAPFTNAELSGIGLTIAGVYLRA